MQGADLCLSLAEIAGVFVGFGALIAVRSAATMGASEINGIRWVVTTAIWVVIVALAPIIVSSYGLTEPRALARVQPPGTRPPRGS